jgi:hypothetical protein
VNSSAMYTFAQVWQMSSAVPPCCPETTFRLAAPQTGRRLSQIRPRKLAIPWKASNWSQAPQQLGSARAHVTRRPAAGASCTLRLAAASACCALVTTCRTQGRSSCWLRPTRPSAVLASTGTWPTEGHVLVGVVATAGPCRSWTSLTCLGQKIIHAEL